MDKVAGKGLSTEHYTSAEKLKLAGITAGAQPNAVTSVAGRTGAVTVAKGDVGLGNVDNNGTATQAESEAGTVTIKFMIVVGKSGAVTLAKSDVELNNFDNTADDNKPVSTAQQTTLNAKAPLASPAFIGTPTVPTPATADNTTKAASTAYVKAQGYSKITLVTTSPTDANVDI